MCTDICLRDTSCHLSWHPWAVRKERGSAAGASWFCELCFEMWNFKLGHIGLKLFRLECNVQPQTHTHTANLTESYFKLNYFVGTVIHQRGRTQKKLCGKWYQTAAESRAHYLSGVFLSSAKFRPLSAGSPRSDWQTCKDIGDGCVVLGGRSWWPVRIDDSVAGHARWPNFFVRFRFRLLGLGLPTFLALQWFWN